MGKLKFYYVTNYYVHLSFLLLTKNLENENFLNLSHCVFRLKKDWNTVFLYKDITSSNNDLKKKWNRTTIAFWKWFYSIPCKPSNKISWKGKYCPFLHLNVVHIDASFINILPFFTSLNINIKTIGIEHKILAAYTTLFSQATKAKPISFIVIQTFYIKIKINQ